MKIEDAKQKICPHRASGSRVCVVDKCMMWRWDTITDQIGPHRFETTPSTVSGSCGLMK